MKKFVRFIVILSILISFFARHSFANGVYTLPEDPKEIRVYYSRIKDAVVNKEFDKAIKYYDDILKILKDKKCSNKKIEDLKDHIDFFIMPKEEMVKKSKEVKSLVASFNCSFPSHLFIFKEIKCDLNLDKKDEHLLILIDKVKDIEEHPGLSEIYFYVFDQDKNLIDKTDNVALCSIYPPNVEIKDITNDGYLEIVLSSVSLGSSVVNCHIAIYNLMKDKLSQLFRGYSSFLSERYKDTLTDIDKDGRLELVICKTIGEKFFCWQDWPDIFAYNKEQNKYEESNNKFPEFYQEISKRLSQDYKRSIQLSIELAYYYLNSLLNSQNNKLEAKKIAVYLLDQYDKMEPADKERNHYIMEYIEENFSELLKKENN